MCNNSRFGQFWLSLRLTKYRNPTIAICRSTKQQDIILRLLLWYLGGNCDYFNVQQPWVRQFWLSLRLTKYHNPTIAVCRSTKQQDIVLLLLLRYLGENCNYFNVQQPWVRPVLVKPTPYQIP